MVQDSQRTSQQNASRREAVIETAGETFSDGTLLELASDTSSAERLNLLYWCDACESRTPPPSHFSHAVLEVADLVVTV
jgi:hypothetical protein